MKNQRADLCSLFRKTVGLLLAAYSLSLSSLDYAGAGFIDACEEPGKEVKGLEDKVKESEENLKKLQAKLQSAKQDEAAKLKNDIQKETEKKEKLSEEHTKKKKAYDGFCEG